MLNLKNISKSYQTGDFRQMALKNVNVSFRDQEFVAILGPSGSGKTTLLNVIGGLDRYDSGDLVIDGRSTQLFRNPDWDAYRNNSIGFIFQSYNLISHLSVLANVEMSLTLSGISKATRREKSLKLLDRVGLSEHVHKLPNQLSGGQMQRVAIARALVNDPEVILADEPTGALDSQTSIQIMELIKEIAQEKLVIMVTHNDQLAVDYADRVVRFQDGAIISDSNEFTPSEVNSDHYGQLKKTAMSFVTALKSSGRNIMTKKLRTILIAIASSIGIIGVSLVLSLSNGVQNQVNKLQEQMISSAPISINQQSTDLSAMLDGQKEIKDYPKSKEVDPFDQDQLKGVHKNNLNHAYVDYIKKIKRKLVSDIDIVRNVALNVIVQKGDHYKNVPVSNSPVMISENNTDDNNMLIGLSNDNVYSGSKGNVLKDNYDVLAGRLPQNDHELILVVDKKNQINKKILDSYGFNTKSAIAFQDFLKMKLKLIPNDQFYEQSAKAGTFAIREPSAEMFNDAKAQDLKIVGVLRKKKDVPGKLISEGIAYSEKLVDEMLELNRSSAIVKAQKENKTVNVLSKQPITADLADNLLQLLGGEDTPISIKIYSDNFSKKEQVTDYLDQWNKGKKSRDKVIYDDAGQIMGDAMTGFVGVATLALTAIASVSLIVSMIMIGIITYISVLERTKEIGILRALGARRKDISRIFNAENFIIGTIAGGLGVGVAALLTIPVNAIVHHFNEDINQIAQPSIFNVLLLIGLSIVLTLLAGALPASWASRKDPVTALRTE